MVGNPATAEVHDEWIDKFHRHLATDRGASAYTQRNYVHALKEFCRWHSKERQRAPAWGELQRDDFRNYLRRLGRQGLGRAAIQLRFCALRSLYKFLIVNGTVAASPIKNLALPKLGRPLPKFLTLKQMEDLLAAPLKPLSGEGAATNGKKANLAAACHRDVAVLETIYSCGLRISELCGLRAEDIDWHEELVRVRGKGKKERLLPVGSKALAAIKTYWGLLPEQPGGNAPVFGIPNTQLQNALGGQPFSYTPPPATPTTTNSSSPVQSISQFLQNFGNNNLFGNQPQDNQP